MGTSKPTLGEVASADSRMNHLFLFSCCLAFALSVDFKHFPVKTGRQDAIATPVPVRPPGRREKVQRPIEKKKTRLPDPSSDYSDDDEDVRNVPTRTTERVRVNSNRIRGRTRIVAKEKAVAPTSKPIRQRIRIRTKPPKTKNQKTQKPTISIQQKPTKESTAIRNTAIRINQAPVIKDAVIEAQEATPAKPSFPRISLQQSQKPIKPQKLPIVFSDPSPVNQLQKVTPNQPEKKLQTSPSPNQSILPLQPQSEKSRVVLPVKLQSFPPVQALSDQKSSSQAHNAQTGQPQRPLQIPSRLIQEITSLPALSRPQVQIIPKQITPKPIDISVPKQVRPFPLTEEQIFPQNSIQPNSIPQQPFQSIEEQRQFQPNSIQQQPFLPKEGQSKFQPNTQQPQPFVLREEQKQPSQQFQPNTIQTQPRLQIQPQPRPVQFSQPPLPQSVFTTQLSDSANQPSVPTSDFQQRPPLFSTPLEIPPQPDGTGASFSYEAFVG